jgi:hypothetical protein
VHVLNPSSLGGKDRRMSVPGVPEQKCEIPSEKCLKQKWAQEV